MRLKKLNDLAKYFSLFALVFYTVYPFVGAYQADVLTQAVYAQTEDEAPYVEEEEETAEEVADIEESEDTEDLEQQAETTNSEDVNEADEEMDELEEMEEITEVRDETEEIVEVTLVQHPEPLEDELEEGSDEQPEQTGFIKACKFEDNNGNGEWDKNIEAPVENWEITLTRGERQGQTQETGEDGCTTFEDIPFGEYTVYEVMQDGWVNTTETEQTVKVDNSERNSVLFGNQRENQTLENVCEGMFGTSNDLIMSSVETDGDINFFANQLDQSITTAVNQDNGDIYYLSSGLGDDIKFYIYHTNDGTTDEVALSNIELDERYPRLTIHPNGTLYAMNAEGKMYTLNYTTGEGTFVGDITGIKSGGGDMVFDLAGNLYLVDYTGNFYEINLTTLEAEKLTDFDVEYFTGLTLFDGDFYMTSLSDGTPHPAATLVHKITLAQILADEEPELLKSTDGWRVNDLASCADSKPEQEINVCEGVFGTGRGEQIEEVDLVTGALSFVDNQLAVSISTAIDKATNKIYYLDLNGENLYVYNPNTASTVTIPTSGLNTANIFPKMAFDGFGTLYVADSANGLYTVNKTTGAATFVATITGIDGSGGDMVFTPTGELYVVEYTGGFFSVNTTTFVATQLIDFSDFRIGKITGLALYDDVFYMSNSVVRQNIQYTPIRTFTLTDVSNNTAPTLLNENPEHWINDLASCVEANESNDGSISGHKYEDLNGNGHKDANESPIEGWEISLCMGEPGNNPVDDRNCAEIASVLTDANGYYEFTNLAAGKYKVLEEIRPTHIVIAPTNGQYIINLAQGQNLVARNFFNQPTEEQEEPRLLISKANNTGGTPQDTDDIVTFTITVESKEDNASDVVVTDLPADGFKYVSGSWTAHSSIHGDIKGSVVEPTYNSPGQWFLGSMAQDEIITLTYQTDIQDDVDPGNYKDLAFAESNGDVLAQAQAPGQLDDTYVGTNVEVQDEDSDSANVEIDEEEEIEEVKGDVLGASTSLPQTGPNTIWILLASFIMLTGLSLVCTSIALRIKNAKKVAIFSLVFALTCLGSQVFAASPLHLRVEAPDSPANSAFSITFVTLDTQNREVTAKCFKKGPTDGGFSQFGPDFTSTGGDSDVCTIDNSILTANGVYDFKVTATAGADMVEETVTVAFNDEAPSKPKFIEKDKKNSCKNEITFKTANDGVTAYVEVYKSTEKSFDANASTRIKTISIGPNTEHTFDDEFFGSDCGKTYYYAVRAFSAAGIGSSVRGEVVIDKEIKVTASDSDSENTSNTTGAQLGTGGAVILSEEELAALNGETGDTGGTGGPTDEETTNADGDVLGSLEDLMNGEDDSSNLTKPIIVIPLLLLVGLVAYAIYKKVKKAK